MPKQTKDENSTKFKEEHVKICVEGSLREWRLSNPSEPLCLEGADLRGLTLKLPDHKALIIRPAFMSKVNLEGATLHNCNFSEVNLVGANLSNASFQKCLFNHANLEGVNLETSLIQGDGVKTNFQNAQLNSATLQGNFSHASFKNASLLDAELHITGGNINFFEANLSLSKFTKCNIELSTFNKASLRDSKIIDSMFKQCRFVEANINGLVVDKVSGFPSSDFKDSCIDRFSLECIDDKQIPISSRVEMIIEDDLAKLKHYYSGYYRILNSVLLFLFVAPYLYFIGKLWLIAKFIPDNPDNTITMIGAIGRYIVSGGRSWEHSWEFACIPMITFSIAFIYNFCRFILLYKTISLEHQQEIRGLPINFKLVGKWENIFNFNRIFIWFNIAAVTIHTWHFLIQRVIVGVG